MPAEKNKLTLRAVQSIGQRRRVGQGDPTNRLFLLFTHRVQRETQSESESNESKMPGKRVSKPSKEWTGCYVQVKNDHDLFDKESWIAVVRVPDDTQAGPGVRPIEPSGMLVEQYATMEEARIAAARALEDIDVSNAKIDKFASMLRDMRVQKQFQRVTAGEMQNAGASLKAVAQAWKEDDESDIIGGLPDWMPALSSPTSKWVSGSCTNKKYATLGLQVGAIDAETDEYAVKFASGEVKMLARVTPELLTRLPQPLRAVSLPPSPPGASSAPDSPFRAQHHSERRVERSAGPRNSPRAESQTERDSGLRRSARRSMAAWAPPAEGAVTRAGAVITPTPGGSTTAGAVIEDISANISASEETAHEIAATAAAAPRVRTAARGGAGGGAPGLRSGPASEGVSARRAQQQPAQQQQSHRSASAERAAQQQGRGTTSARSRARREATSLLHARGHDTRGHDR